MEEIAELLNINPAAMEVWANIRFLFRTQEEVDLLKEMCVGTGRRFIDHYMKRKRLAALSRDSLTCEIFSDEFNANRKAAMERLTQQPLSEGKLLRLRCADPQRIFRVYREQPLGTSYMDLILLLQNG